MDNARMEENPYKTPQAAELPVPTGTARRSATVLRLLLAWQIIAIGASGLWARNGSGLGALADAVVAIIPITGLAVPLAVGWIAVKQDPGSCLRILLVQILLWGCYLVALLPSVQ